MVIKMPHFDYKRAKKAVLYPFSKFRKLFKTETARSSSKSPPNRSNDNDNCDNSNNAGKVGKSLLCCLCVSKDPQCVDISSDGIDPNDPNVSYGSLKSLLEKNDFYSEECNTHLLH